MRPRDPSVPPWYDRDHRSPPARAQRDGPVVDHLALCGERPGCEGQAAALRPLADPSPDAAPAAAAAAAARPSGSSAGSATRQAPAAPPPPSSLERLAPLRVQRGFDGERIVPVVPTAPAPQADTAKQSRQSSTRRASVVPTVASLGAL